MIVDALWYVTNEIIHNDLEVPMVKDEVKKYECAYKARLKDHSNILASSLMDDRSLIRRLKRKIPQDLIEE